MLDTISGQIAPGSVSREDDMRIVAPRAIANRSEGQYPSLAQRSNKVVSAA
jgi:hypothetical protein